MNSLHPRGRAVCATVALSFAICAFAPSARAEKILAQDDNWEVYTDGRVGAFVSYVHGNGYPQSTTYTNASGTVSILHDVKGGGWPNLVSVEQQPVGADPTVLNQGTIESMRVRSGMIGNTFGLGVRSTISDKIKASAYFQIWAFVESLQREKNQTNFADVRQGYASLETPWGSLQAGRMRGLFSRGATDIDVLYAHRWGVGFPGGDNIDGAGFSNGQIGFGLLGSGFSSALQYATPVLGGLQLSVGIYDPIVLQGSGAWNRTKWGRPEAELTFERPLANSGKIVLFASGTYQEVLKQGYCPPDGSGGPCSEFAAGVVYGGRFEYGPFHLGASGFYGKGTGLNYALEVNDANLDPRGVTRIFDGYYVQAQLALNPIDVFAGAGIVRLFLTDTDKQQVQDPRFPNDPTQLITPHSVLKDQIGVNAGIVYNITSYLHADLDLFRAQADWFLGEQQVIYVANTGMTYNW